jgi:hypothetical protein
VQCLTHCASVCNVTCRLRQVAHECMSSMSCFDVAAHVPPAPLPVQYSKDWLPHAPVTYQEALRRQQRLLHGPQRRSFLYLHR